MPLIASVAPTPRSREARFLAQVLLPFVERAIDVALVRRGRSVQGHGGVEGLDAFIAAAESADAAIVQVAGALGLEALDVAVLAFAIAPYLEPRIARRYRELQESAL